MKYCRFVFLSAKPLESEDNSWRGRITAHRGQEEILAGKTPTTATGYIHPITEGQALPRTGGSRESWAVTGAHDAWDCALRPTSQLDTPGALLSCQAPGFSDPPGLSERLCSRGKEGTEFVTGDTLLPPEPHP